MRKTLLACTALAAFALVAPKAEALPVQPSALGHVSEATDITQKAAAYVFEGRRYCFYFSGWHGAGWYRCGFAYRRGLGWGGEYDWGVRYGWSNPGWERRHGRGHVDSQRGPSNRSTTTTTRERTTIRGNSDAGGRMGGNVRTRERGGDRNMNSQSGGRPQGTTGAGPRSGGGNQGGAAVQGGANMRGGGNPGGAAVQGGANAGGGAKAQGGGNAAGAGAGAAGGVEKKQ